MSVETESDGTDGHWVALGGVGVRVLWEGLLPGEHGPGHPAAALNASHGRQSCLLPNYGCPGRGNMVTVPQGDVLCPSQSHIGPRA